MKKLILGLSLVLGAGIAHAQTQGLENIIVEKYYVSGAADNTGDYPIAEGSITYRIYVDMLPGYNFQAIYGSPTQKLEISTTTTFFNNEDRGNTTPTYTKLQAAKNTVMLDSWFSVGAAMAGQIGVLKSKDNGVGTIVNSDNLLQNNSPLAGIALTEQDGMIEGTIGNVNFSPGLDVSIFADENNSGGIFTVGGSGLSTDTGVIYSAPGTMGTTNDNIVLIGQFTTNGDFSFQLNIQIGNANFETESYVSSNPSGNEILFAPLTQTFKAQLNLPEVAITSPLANAKFLVNNTVQITANATDADGTISEVEFFVDGVSIGVDNSAPYAANYTALEGTHIITAIAKDNDNQVKTSEEVSIVVEKETSIEKLTQNKTNIDIYPTVVDNYVMVSLSNSDSPAFCEVFDIIGNLLYSKECNQKNNKIELSTLKQGKYIINISQNNETTTKKIIKK